MRIGIVVYLVVFPTGVGDQLRERRLEITEQPGLPFVDRHPCCRMFDKQCDCAIRVRWQLFFDLLRKSITLRRFEVETVNVSIGMIPDVE